jgi:hypothetical protein
MIVLALEFDPAQTVMIRQVVCDLVGAHLTLVQTIEEAVQALLADTPDLVLLPALLLPTEEATLLAALRTTPGSTRVETLFTPVFLAGDECAKVTPLWWHVRGARRGSTRSANADPRQLFAERLNWSLGRAPARQARPGQCQVQSDTLASGPDTHATLLGKHSDAVAHARGDALASLGLTTDGDNASAGQRMLIASDRRAHQRIPARHLPRLRSARIKFGPSVSLLDVSTGGALVQTATPLQRGSEALLELVGDGTLVVIPFRVVRCQISALDDPPLYAGACAFTQPLDLSTLGLPSPVRAQSGGDALILPQPVVAAQPSRLRAVSGQAATPFASRSATKATSGVTPMQSVVARVRMAARSIGPPMRAHAIKLGQATVGSLACARVAPGALITQGTRTVNRAQIVTRQAVHALIAGLALARAHLSVPGKQMNAGRVETSVCSTGGSKSLWAVKRPPPHSRSTRRLRPLAAALFLLVLCVTLAFGVAATSSWRIAQLEAATPRAPVVERVERPRKIKPTGTLQLTSTPQGVAVVVDGRKRGMTPLRIDDLAVGTHEVRFESDGSSVHQAVSVRAGRASTLEMSLYPGWVAVFSPIELEISEDGRRLRLDDDNRAILPPGRHELQLVNRALDFHDTKLIDVTPLKVTALSIDLPKSLVTITATPSAEVWIDGARAGETPLIDLPISIGTREILLRNPALGERRRIVIVTPSKLRIDVNLAESGS